MTQILVNKFRADVRSQQPDIFPIFAETVAKIDEADAAGCEVTRDIGYATVDAILDAAVDIIPRDIENVLHRIGCAHQLLDTVYDRAYRGLEIDEVIKKLEGLLRGTAKGLADAYAIDMRATRLDFYLPQRTDQQN
ncbi:hypothetical protein [Rhizobium ruizarguesonis]|uniref:hypothetical protein n=1 Tax=Rhizobium ruizarguesonis TaxID=2081791 RepID=UPI00041AD407|nr:hypothetical protein [Rhizobium ruizarguesonis]QJS27157.1 hypothetical protein RLTA1_07540 [Rhizobium leguminosarum bv. trifolii TA1]UFW95898.1 hypothetical protein RlegTA1_07520 [Rhizobium ruizarguesonis]